MPKVPKSAQLRGVPAGNDAAIHNNRTRRQDHPAVAPLHRGELKPRLCEAFDIVKQRSNPHMIAAKDGFRNGSPRRPLSADSSRRRGKFRRVRHELYIYEAIHKNRTPPALRPPRRVLKFLLARGVSQFGRTPL